ncbi:MAG: alpha/beta hydrolase-fold protein [Acidobacteria bacterium]|nr:alpha/beta hydrolase-fold protein [Acidobacteriota bacterium]
MSDKLLPSIGQEPPRPATAAVIWLHGLGADGHDFAPIVPQLGLGDDHPVRFIFPHAPSIPVTLNGGFVMPAWYDIKSLEVQGQDEAGIRVSDAEVQRFIAREVERGIATERIVVAGFSQGGAIALFTGLRYPERLAGIMALSAYLVAPEALEAELSAANRQVPIFQAHGSLDPMVPHDKGLATRRWLTERGWDVEAHDYPMAHEVCLEEIEAIGLWLRRVLALEG